MSERKLRNRQKRASKGKIIRVSDAVFRSLNQTRNRRSWDDYLRWLLGLPNRNGIIVPLIEGALDTATGVFVLKTGAEWTEVLDLAARITSGSRPVRMRELR